MKIQTQNLSEKPLKPTALNPFFKKSPAKVLFPALPQGVFSLKNLIKTLNLPETPQASGLALSFLRSGVDLSPEQASKIAKNALNENLSPGFVPLLWDTGGNLPEAILKIENPVSLPQWLTLFLNLGKEQSRIYLPLDFRGGFLRAEKQGQKLSFSLYLTFPGLKTFYFSGWAHLEPFQGEGFCSFYPPVSQEFFQTLKHDLALGFPGFALYENKREKEL